MHQKNSNAKLQLERGGLEEDEDEYVELPYHIFSELLKNPELLVPPPVVLPRLAWQGRVTLLAAPEKFGKSTLMGQGVAAVAHGQPFLGEHTPSAGALWMALDEPLGDLVRRLAGYGARDGIYICDVRPSWDVLEAAILDQQVGLVVIDTLTEFAAGLMDDMNSAMQWQPVLSRLRGIAQRTKSGLVLLHHANKSTGKYRDSSQIGAGVDAIIEMFPAPQDPTMRQCRARGRVRMGDFTLRFADPWYEIQAGEVPVLLRTYRAMESQPGMGKAKLRAAVGGKAAEVDAAVWELIRTGAAEDRGVSPTHAYYTVRPFSEAGPGLDVGQPRDNHWDNPPPAELSPLEQGGSTQGQNSGQPLLSPPYIHRGGTGYGGLDNLQCDFCKTPQRKTVHGMFRCPQCCPDNRWAA
jgi:hypothetical protein